MKVIVRICLMILSACSVAAAQNAEDLRRERNQLAEKGLWADALAFYKEKLSALSDKESGKDLEMAVGALNRVDDSGEFDALVEGAVASHRDNPTVLLAAAEAYANASSGFGVLPPLPGREMRRGRPGGPAAMVSTGYRDRIRTMQLILEALDLPLDDPLKIRAWHDMATALKPRDGSWKFQILTPLDTLPPWDEPGPQGGTEGVPWKGDGPVLYEVPASWAAAKNDGERWRFALSEMSKLGKEPAAAAILERAEFSEEEFGQGGLWPGFPYPEMDDELQKGVLELASLGDDEVLVRTSDGIRRFRLPPDQHFIALYRSLLDNKESGDDAGDALVRVYLGRGQFVKARDALERTIAEHGDGPEGFRKSQLRQIVGNWGRFGQPATVAAGTKPVLPLFFRNAKSVKFTASPVDMDAVLADTMTYLKENPRELEWDRINPSMIASRIVNDGKLKYVGAPAAEWNAELEPDAGHLDRQRNITMPLDKAGAWWVTAEIGEGNTFHTLVWILDTVLAQRDVAGGKQWWVADAENGAPVSGAEVVFFGYRSVPRERKAPTDRRMDIETASHASVTDEDGRVVVKPGELEMNHQWMAIARKDGRSTAFFGFQPFPINEPSFGSGNRDLGYGITDRPLYKPGDTLHVKFYLRNVGYFEPDEAKYANRQGTLALFNGRGEEALKISDLKTDELGAVEASAVIPSDAPLGQWQAAFSIGDQISHSVGFRVEEYRKPEYEVSVEAPSEPVRLGDAFPVKVTAAYFHGAPVRQADVEITVKRTALHDRWFPAGRWDWLYGRGAWWPGAPAAWHPRWHDWNCGPSIPPRGQRRWTPDEVILKRTSKIGADGTVAFEIDTADAKRLHGDMDSKFVIEARVTDASRREEKASGEVIAARKPFEVVIWTDRGFAIPGSEIEARVAASSLSGKAVMNAKGTLKLFKLGLGGDGKVTETEFMSWDVTTGGDGSFAQKFSVAHPGQYRLAAVLSLDGGEAVESASILNVHGAGRAEPSEWKFGPVELLADKLEYKPGDILNLRVNSDRADAHVWLFLHVGGAGGVETRRVRLDGKSLAVEVPLDRRDMPNMFVEAITIHGAMIHTAYREILVPPESKLIDVVVEAEKPEVGPGEKSVLRLSLADAAGNPVAGKAVVAVYDKALEAITGGGNVPPIREAFWGWRNYYHEGRSSCSVPVSPGNLNPPEAAGMSLLDSLIHPLGGGIAFGGGEPMPSMRSAEFSMAMPQAAAADAFAPSPKEQAAPVVVRKDFADLLKWVGTVVADADGKAEVPLEFPDNLTTWKARVWVLGSGTRVGEGSAEIVTAKDLMIRPQLPRFLVERDEAVVSAVVHNEHDIEKEVSVSLEVEGNAVTVLDGKSPVLKVPAKGEARVDWKVRAVGEGNAKVRMIARAADDGDAVERDLPVKVNGMLRQDAWSRVISEDASSVQIPIEVPKDTRRDEALLTVRFSPTVSGAVVDSIPYLAAYPHGCTEQTLNRFMPAVVARKMLFDMNIDLAAVKQKRINLNPQELGDPQARSEGWRQWKENPVFDPEELAKITRAGMEKLVGMQNTDGGWGWFSGYGETSYAHTTAVVMHGLLVGRLAGVDAGDQVIARGLAWLAGHENREVAALERHVKHQEMIARGETPPPSAGSEKTTADALDAMVRQVLGEAGTANDSMAGYLFRDRVKLPVYALALIGLEFHRMKDEPRRDEVMAMISQYLKSDAENQTSWLDLRNGDFWWNWYGSEIEANAWYLKLLTAVKPADPETRGLAKYLVNNRRGGSYWNSTRDTAYAVEALSAFARTSGEMNPEMEVEILMDGKTLARTSINADNLFSFDGTVTLSGKDVPVGKHQIEIRRTGKGAVYANAYLQVFTLEDRLRAAGLEVKVKRKVYRITEDKRKSGVPDKTGIVTEQAEERIKRELLDDGATLASGDRLEVELILESKNDYEYLIFSDAKGAGFEPFDVLSGYVSSGGISAYMEPRDRTVDFFIRALPRGTSVLRYRLRAETPGTFKALPATASAMYAPELRGNSEDFRLRVRE